MSWQNKKNVSSVFYIGTVLIEFLNFKTLCISIKLSFEMIRLIEKDGIRSGKDFINDHNMKG